MKKINEIGRSRKKGGEGESKNNKMDKSSLPPQ